MYVYFCVKLICACYRHRLARATEQLFPHVTDTDWHVQRSNCFHEAVEVLRDEEATLEACNLRDGDTLTLKPGRLPPKVGLIPPDLDQLLPSVTCMYMYKGLCSLMFFVLLYMYSPVCFQDHFYAEICLLLSPDSTSTDLANKVKGQLHTQCHDRCTTVCK